MQRREQPAASPAALPPSAARSCGAVAAPAGPQEGDNGSTRASTSASTGAGANTIASIIVSSSTSFNDLPPELQRRIVLSAMPPEHSSCRRGCAKLRLACRAARAAVDACVTTLQILYRPRCLYEAAACCGRWRGLRWLMLDPLPAKCAWSLQELLVAAVRQCPSLCGLSINFKEPDDTPPLLTACAYAAARAARIEGPLRQRRWPITSLCLAGAQDVWHDLSALGALTTLTCLQLNIPVSVTSGSRWLPPSLRRLELHRGCGPAWLAAAPRCSEHLTSLELSSLDLYDVFGWVPNIAVGGAQLSATLRQLTNLQHLAGILRIQGADLQLSGLPPQIRTALLYTRPHSRSTSLFPCRLQDWQRLSNTAPLLEQLAVTPVGGGPWPQLPHLRFLALASLNGSPPPPATLSDFFPSLKNAWFEDVGGGPNWPPPASLATCRHLVNLCLIAPTATWLVSPDHALSQLSQITTLADLQLCGAALTASPPGMGFRSGDFWFGKYHPFAEFEGAVRAPALTRLEFSQLELFDLRSDGSGRAAIWAALRAAAAAGEALRIDEVASPTPPS